MSATKRLVEKLHPVNFTEMSSQMAAIVAYILGESWTDPVIGDINITSDGFVIMDGGFLGSVSDLERNWSNLLDAADLTDGEREYAQELYAKRITDWRKMGV